MFSRFGHTYVYVQEEEEEEIYLTQIRNNHGNSTQVVQSQVARKPEGQQCWPPIEHTNC